MHSRALHVTHLCPRGKELVKTGLNYGVKDEEKFAVLQDEEKRQHADYVHILADGLRLGRLAACPTCGVNTLSLQGFPMLSSNSSSSSTSPSSSSAGAAAAADVNATAAKTELRCNGYYG